jgi:hypothetical protein
MKNLMAYAIVAFPFLFTFVPSLTAQTTPAAVPTSQVAALAPETIIDASSEFIE